jgi:hypothetical protein
MTATPCAKQPTVELMCNCYEGTYRIVLTREYWLRLTLEQQSVLHRRIALINNVNDRAHASKLAEDLLKDGVLDAYFFVADYADRALSEVGLRYTDLGRIPHYSDWAFVAAYVCDSDYLLHWDAEIRLVSPHDWITPCVTRLESDARAFAANPLWSGNRFSLERTRAEAFAEDDTFLLGYGFSDQVYLARSADLRKPIYHHWHPFSLRYPLSHVAGTFEQRVDSAMRRLDRIRITYKHVSYAHPVREGKHYPALTPVEHVRRMRNGAVVKLGRFFAGWR